MVSAHAQRCHPRRSDPGVAGLDVLVALLQAEAAAKRHIADVGDLARHEGRQAMHVVIGPDALHGPHRAGTKPRAGAVGDAEVHGHADEGRVETAQIRSCRASRRIGAPSRVETPS